MALREVRLEYRGVNTYLVEAADDESAEMIARQRYVAGDDGDSTGSEWDHVEGVTVGVVVSVLAANKKEE